MKDYQQSKEYKTPQFQIVKQDEQNSVFFTASGTTQSTDVKSLGTTTLSSIQSW